MNSCPIAHYANAGFLNELDTIKLVSDALNIPIVTVEEKDYQKIAAKIPKDIFEKVPLERWRELKVLPLSREGAKLKAAFANPLDHEAKTSLDFALGEALLISIMPENTLCQILTKCLTESHSDSTEEIFASQERTVKTQPISTNESIITAKDVEAPPIVRLVNKILLDAFEAGASDIHLTPEKEFLKVKIRRDGILKELFEIPGSMAAPITSRIKLLGGMDISEKRRPQDGRLRVQFGGVSKDLRLSTIPALHGENIVARVLSSDYEATGFESLGLPKDVRTLLSQDIRGSSRVVLVTGPTGSGKTSTLYACINDLKDEGLNIITIEDPIEYRVPGILQTQVNTKIGVTFADGLRSILRQDPDVVVVGEVRDAETARIAMQVAQTGHLVLSTLHTNSAPSAITRLHDLGVQDFLLASSLQAIMAQRLVRRGCPSCKGEKGCDNCGGTGYRGRIGIYSLLHLNDHLREMIRKGTSEIHITSEAKKYGFLTLEEAALRVVETGITRIEEVERVLGPQATWNISNPQVQVPETNGIAIPGKPEKGRKAGKRRVLLVEDDENMRTVLTMLLERARYEVTGAGNGSVALEMLLENPPDLVLCDMMMPEMSGTELVTILRRDPMTRDIPVLMLTAADTQENELKLMSCGADDFVSKTTDQKILLARVERLILRSAEH